MKFNRKIFNLKNILKLSLTILLLWALKWLYLDIKERIRIANLKDTASPNVQILEDFAYIKSLDRKRTIRIYLPPNHDKDSLRYPVIYMLDGENLFNDIVSRGNEWQVDEVVDETIAKGGPGAIIVAIDDADKDRNTEYKPFDPDTGEDAEGVKLLDYIAYELKPIIDRKYKTLPEKENTCIIGASLGGIMSLYGVTMYYDTFGKAGLFSPSLWVSERFYKLLAKITNWKDIKIFINVGDSEGFMDDDAKKLHQALLDAGMPEEHLRISIEEGMGHYHATWRQGFQKAYPWLMK